MANGQTGQFNEDDTIFFVEVQGDPRKQNYAVSTAQVNDLVCFCMHGESPSLITDIQDA